MKKFIVFRESDIILDDGRYLLESGDEIMVGPFEDEDHQSINYWLNEMSKTKDPVDRKKLTIKIKEAGMEDEVVGFLKQMQSEFEGSKYE